MRDDVKLAFDVYGVEEDRNYARDCRQMQSELGTNIRLGFKGPIPHHEVFGTIQGYHLFILPSLGENFGHAIYEALSAGDPVVISDQTPWRNLKKKRPAGIYRSIKKINSRTPSGRLHHGIRKNTMYGVKVHFSLPKTVWTFLNYLKNISSYSGECLTGSTL